jgi:hypothetical protein
VLAGANLHLYSSIVFPDAARPPSHSGFNDDNIMTDQLCVFNLDSARYEPLPDDFVRLDASAFHSASLIGSRIVFSSLPSWATSPSSSSSSSATVTTMPPDLIALETCADPRATTRPGQRYLRHVVG